MAERRDHLLFTYDHYRGILRLAIDNNYQFIGFKDLRPYCNEERFCLLRHDCDNDLLAAVRLAEIEAKAGVRATYFVMLRSAMYNVFCIASSRLVRSILELGHWLGLHFDERYYADATLEQLLDYVSREQALLSDEFGTPITSVSFHQPSERVLRNEIKLEGCLATHDRRYFGDIFYLSDSNMHRRVRDLGELFASCRYPRVQLLIHPEWWTDSSMTLQEKWNHMLSNQFSLMQSSLLEREAAYTIEQRILFQPVQSRARPGNDDGPSIKHE